MRGMIRVSFQVSGGLAFFPGLAAPRTIDVDTLPERTRLEMTSLIEESRFFSLPSPALPPGPADCQTYRITIQDDARQHTIVVSDPVMSRPLQRLIEVLQDL
jgi:Emfourin